MSDDVIDQLFVRMVDPDEFHKLFTEAQSCPASDKELFTALNTLFFARYGIKKYSSYDSFRKTHARWIKKQ